MKIYILFFFFFPIFHDSMGQVILSSCSAPDSIIEKYRDDADRMALKKIGLQNLPFEDSVQIPRTLSDTFLNALIAVYNATSLPERDTVVELLDLHAFFDIELNGINIAADSTLTWMQQLRNGIIPTGYAPLDSLLTAYSFSLENYSDYSGWFFWHLATFYSDSNYNIPALATLFSQVPGVYIAEPVILYYIAHDDISAFIPFFPDDYIQLYYFYAISEASGRGWIFNVYPDCSVEFAGAFGSSFPTSIDREINTSPISISPNPFLDIIMMEGTSSSFRYSITTMAGQQLISGTSHHNSIDNLDQLLPGFYFLTIRDDHQAMTFKIVKK